MLLLRLQDGPQGLHASSPVRPDKTLSENGQPYPIDGRDPREHSGVPRIPHPKGCTYSSSEAQSKQRNLIGYALRPVESVVQRGQRQRRMPVLPSHHHAAVVPCRAHHSKGTRRTRHVVQPGATVPAVQYQHGSNELPRVRCSLRCTIVIHQLRCPAPILRPRL